MGLFGRKKYDKNVTRDNEFLKEYAIKVNALINFAQENDKVVKELKDLKADFQYSVASPDKDAKKLEKKIDTDYKTLSLTLAQPEWDEREVIIMIRGIRQTIIEITSLR